MRVQGACLSGAAAELVTVEARFEALDASRTEVVLSGLPDPVIRESRGRLLSALDANRLEVPRGRLVLNLVPAGRRKAGEILDLPLALGAAAASGHVDDRVLAGYLFLGEVGIYGALHAVPGGLAAAMAAREAGITRVVAPPATAREAASLPGVHAFGPRDLAEVLALLVGGGAARVPLDGKDDDDAGERIATAAGARALARVRGQAVGKRALEVAAAGGHALLFCGPPGTGKSLLARALHALLPPLELDERLEVTRVLSAAGRWPGGLARERPFRAPHHTVSFAGLVGGGSPPSPGEISLAHGGVLFLDELAEFRREALEALRQPLEEGAVAISRAGRQLELPARFQLVCAMNPCPCGYRGHPRVPCRCSPAEVRRYRRRLSGPFLDRVDLRVELASPAVRELSAGAGSGGADSGAADELRCARVAAARELAAGRPPGTPNALLDAAALDRVVPLEREHRRLLERAVERAQLSARAVQSLRRVARSVADLDGDERVGGDHLAEALALRGTS